MPVFRKKIFYTLVFLFLLFFSLLFPFVEYTIAQTLRTRDQKVQKRLLDEEIFKVARDFEWGLVFLSGAILGLYSLAVWVILYRMSLPMQNILNAIRPYQEGKEEFLPRLRIDKKIRPNDDFGKLALTLNSLTARIQGQIAHLVKQKNETEMILDSLGEGVIALDTTGRIIFINPVACQIFHIARECVLGAHLMDLATSQKDLLQKCKELFQLVKEQKETITQIFVEEGVQKAYFNLTAAPQVQHDGIILVLQDKTSDYKIIEVGKDFIANASHELRTPITIIRGFAETLRDLPDVSSEMRKDMTQKIFKTCLRLDSLVKSLLTLSDVGSLNETRFRNVNLVLILENCKYILLTAHPKTEITFHCDFSQVPILADAALMELAILNLLENAVKYSSSPAKINVSLSCSSSLVDLAIKDCGIGIPQEDLTRIFDRFYTVDRARTRKFGGAGLGLSIVSIVIQKHKGSLSVQSELGKGSTFTIRLPLYFQKVNPSYAAVFKEIGCDGLSKVLENSEVSSIPK